MSMKETPVRHAVMRSKDRLISRRRSEKPFPELRVFSCGSSSSRENPSSFAPKSSPAAIVSTAHTFSRLKMTAFTRSRSGDPSGRYGCSRTLDHPHCPRLFSRARPPFFSPSKGFDVNVYMPRRFTVVCRYTGT